MRLSGDPDQPLFVGENMGLFDFITKLLGDSDAMPAAQESGPTTLPEDHGLHKEDFKVIGMGYHPESFARIREANREWRASKKAILEAEPNGKAIDHYTYPSKPVDLMPDPSNEYGIGRIMVFVAGQHIGYLCEEDDAHVSEILKYGSVKYITTKITGGGYRIVFKNGTEQKGEDPMRATVRIAYSV